MKLDKSKPYGQIVGDHVAVFEQEGHFFDANGNEVTDDAEESGDGETKRRRGKTPKPDSDDQLSAQMGDA